MVRAAFYDEKGLKKGAWSKEEDDKLRDYILRYGHWNWRELPKFAGLSRCGKSCRLRWMNYLRPDLKHGNFTKEEDDLIFQLYQQLGTKWSAIASKMSGRTDNEIKNYWHAHLKKRVGGWTKNESRSSSSSPSSSSSLTSSHPQHSGSDQTHRQTYELEADCATMMMISPPILESSPFSPETTFSASPVAGSWEDEYKQKEGAINNNDSYDDYNNNGGDFWSEPFVVDDSTMYDDGDGGEMMRMMMMSYNSDQPYNFPWVGDESTGMMLDDDVESLMYRVMQELPEATTSCYGF